MKFLNKIKRSEYLPVLLFFIVFINYFPLFINNAFTKESNSVNAKVIAVCFAIQVVLLVIYYFINKALLKIKKNDIFIAGIVIIAMLGIQVKNFINNEFFVMDIFNLICVFINILLFFIFLKNYKIDSNKIEYFLKCIVILGIVAVIWNCILYFYEIIALTGIWLKDGLDLYGIKSFFPNRNAFSFFLYISIISNTFLFCNQSNKKKYLFSFIVLLFGIWCSHSKTCFILTIAFLELFIITNTKIKIIKRIIICGIVGIIGIIGILNILGYLHFNIINESKIIESKKSLSNVIKIKGNSKVFLNYSNNNSNKMQEKEENIVSDEIIEREQESKKEEKIDNNQEENIQIDKNKYKINQLTENDLKRMSGRDEIWKVGINILKQSPLNIIFGVGRFKSTNNLKFSNREFTQFHNIYLDIMLTGGIVELIYIGFIYFSVIRRVIKSNLEKSIKKIYFISYITYAVYIMFESCGRFSIGGVDTLCLIYFIAIPLIWSNGYKKNI